MMNRGRFNFPPALALAIAAAGVCRAGDDSLAPVRPNVPVTINALLGNVNGKPLFVDDILKPIHADLLKLADASANVSRFKDEATVLIGREIDAQVNDILVEDAATSALEATDKQMIDAHMNSVRHQILTLNGGSEAEAERTLGLTGTSLEKVLANERRNYTQRVLIEKIITPKIQIVRQQIIDKYNADAKEYAVPAEIELFTISVPVSKFLPQEGEPGSKHPAAHPTEAQVREATNLARERAKDLLQQLKGGADFATLAEQNSGDTHKNQGGRWPHMKRGGLGSRFEDAAFALKANSYGELFTANPDDPQIAAIVIMKAGDVTPAHVIPFTEAQEKITLALWNAQFTKLEREYMDNLRRKAAIEGVDRMVSTAVDAAVGRFLTK